jgi:hypothetical protein
VRPVSVQAYGYYLDAFESMGHRQAALAAAAERSLERSLERTLATLQTHGSIAEHSCSHYEPEQRRFGGPDAMAPAHAHFHPDRTRVRNVLVRDFPAASPGSRTRMGHPAWCGDSRGRARATWAQR